MKSLIIAIVIIGVTFLVFPTQFLGVAVGLVLGWNVLEQPTWVKLAYDWVGKKIAELRSQ